MTFWSYYDEKMEAKITEKQKKVLEAIYENVETSGFPPTLAELKVFLNVSSNQSVLNFLDSLENKGFIRRENEGKSRNTARGIKILPLGLKVLGKRRIIPMAGITSAGRFIESFDASAEWITLRGNVIENEKVKQLKDDVFVIKVQGDSMINAGINDGDVLLVQKTKEFRSNDIVVARSDDGTTVKRFIAEDDGRAYLKPENPKYKNLTIYEDTYFEGKVILNLGGMNKRS